MAFAPPETFPDPSDRWCERRDWHPRDQHLRKQGAKIYSRAKNSEVEWEWQRRVYGERELLELFP